MPEEIKKELSQRIRKIRKANNLNQEAFASKTDVSKDHVSKVENGRLYPNFDLLQNLRNKFDVNLNWLIAGAGKMNFKTYETQQNVRTVGEDDPEYLTFKEKYIEVMEENRKLNEKLRYYMEKENEKKA